MSWIWDGDFEGLHALNAVDTAISGIRVEDLGVRMEVAGFENMKVFKTNAELIDWIRKAPTKKVNVLATYTALLDLRKDFAKEGYLKEGMNG